MVALIKYPLNASQATDLRPCRRQKRATGQAPRQPALRLSAHEAAACEGAFPGNRKRSGLKARPGMPRPRKAGRATAALPVLPAALGDAARASRSHNEQPLAVGDGAFTLYLRQIGRVKPLPPAQENALAQRSKRGDKRARAQLLKSSLPLVVQLAGEFENIGLPLLDLVSEGNLGLFKAIERFDPLTDQAFSTFATWWIKQSIKRALAH